MLLIAETSVHLEARRKERINLRGNHFYLYTKGKEENTYILNVMT